MVREDLSVTQKDKFVLQAKVSELKNNMKTLLQQNQQLKLDLRRSAAKTVSSCTSEERGLQTRGQGQWVVRHKVLFDSHSATVKISGGEFCLDNRPSHFILVPFPIDCLLLFMSSGTILLAWLYKPREALVCCVNKIPGEPGWDRAWAQGPWNPEAAVTYPVPIVCLLACVSP